MGVGRHSKLFGFFAAMEKWGIAYVIAQLAGGVIGAAAAFSSLPRKS